MTNLKFSIIIVNYNGRFHVDRCVHSIISSNITDYEIIVVDNGSNDDSVSFLTEKYKNDKLTIISLDKNYGPAYARNRGAEKAQGKYLGFLDNDTKVEPNWATEAAKEFEADECVGIIQCKLLLLKEPNKIDYIGEFIGQNGFLVQEVAAGTIDDGSHNNKHEILAAKSAGMFIRKDAFDTCGKFDDEYFIYVEETDLGWRARLLGYKAVYLPTSIVFHEFGTSTIILGKAKNNYNAKFHGTKNYILTLFKCLEPLNMLKIIPLHVGLWLGLAGFSCLRGDFKAAFWIVRAVWWNVANLNNSLKKRRMIQSMRKVSDESLFKVVMVKKPFFYFVNKVVNKQKVGNAEGFIKSK